MAKRRTDWDQDKLNRFIKEGRGQGEGKDYKPWITIQDFPSMGRATRVFGWKTNRIHHFLTDTETRYFYLLEWEDEVIDIREHYPLLNIKEVIDEKDDLNFDIFKDRNSGTPYVIYTSFLITTKNSQGEKIYLARSLKAVSELEKRTTLEKLEIERRYWKNKGVDWGVVTEKDIPSIKAKNIEWIHSSKYSYSDREFTYDELCFLCDSYIEMMKISSESIRYFNRRFDKEFNLTSGTGLYIFKYLIATKRVSVDMNSDIDINVLDTDLQIIDKKFNEEGKVLCL